MIIDRTKLNQLYKYGVALTANDQLAWDLVQDAMEKLTSRNFVINKMSYAKRVMRNQFYDILKSKTHSQAVSLDQLDSSVDRSVDSEIEARIDSNAILKKILNQLSPIEREILFLWAVEEYTTNEISKLIDLPKGTVTSKLKRLRDRLQKAAGGEYE